MQIGADRFGAARAPAAQWSISATPLTIVPGGEIDALADSMRKVGQRIAVLAQRLPLKTYQYVHLGHAGKRAEVSAMTCIQTAHARQGRLSRSGAGGPGDERWDAIRDRLARASASNSLQDESSDVAIGVLP